MTFSAFVQPGVSAAVEFEPLGRPIAASPEGDLYVARLGEMVAAVIAAPRQRIRALDQLGVEPEVASISDQGSASLVADQMARWAKAPLPGSPIARVRRSLSVRKLHEKFIVWVCGPGWIEAEDRFMRSRSANAWLQLRGTLRSTSGMALADAIARSTVWRATKT